MMRVSDLKAGHSRWVVANNNPVTFVDHTGLQPGDVLDDGGPRPPQYSEDVPGAPGPIRAIQESKGRDILDFLGSEEFTTDAHWVCYIQCMGWDDLALLPVSAILGGVPAALITATGLPRNLAQKSKCVELCKDVDCVPNSGKKPGDFPNVEARTRGVVQSNKRRQSRPHHVRLRRRI